MSSLRYVLLSLLSREPLSGYDMKKQMATRIYFFYEINNNQLYPTLAKLESEGLIQIGSYEKESYRPTKKIYNITDNGMESLKSWITEPSKPEDWDEIVLKQYSAWLIKPDVMIPLLKGMKKEHKERLNEYQTKIAELRGQHPPLTSSDPIFSSIAVIELGIKFESGFIEWCEQIMDSLEKDCE